MISGIIIIIIIIISGIIIMEELATATKRPQNSGAQMK